MAQHDYIISNATFPAVRADINNALSAIQTTNSGTSRPTGAVAGQMWLDTTNATSPTLKFFDGADDISFATINYTTNTVDWLDSSITITGLSTTATGTVLTLSDTANTTSVNLIIDNQKEIRFRETTANGTNYVAFKAPASLSADLTFTLPSADGTSGQALVTNGSGVLSFSSAGISWQSVQTTGFTASAGKGYPCNTTSSAFTITLPASATTGDTIQIVDYAGTFATNNITLNRNGLKIDGGTLNKLLTTNREAVSITYIDSTQGWVASSGTNYGSQSLDPNTFTADFLVVAGGGGGGGNNLAAGSGAGGGGAGGYRYLTSQTLNKGDSYTVTVGAGGSGGAVDNNGTTGSNSVFSSTTSAGGGGGGKSAFAGLNGGSGGGGSDTSLGGSGNTPSTSPSQGNNGGNGSNATPYYAGGGGGGSSAVGSNGSGTAGGSGGNGTANSITGSSVTYAGGGGGGTFIGGTAGSGGTGGGGSAVVANAGNAGTANTGGGGGGGSYKQTPATSYAGGNGGSGIVIIKYPDTLTVSNSGGGLTFSTTTSAPYKITSFTAGTGTVQFN